MADKVSLDWCSFTLRVDVEAGINEAIDQIRLVLQEDKIIWLEKSRLKGYSRSGLLCDGLGYIGYHNERLEMGVHCVLPSSALAVVAARFGDGFDFIKFLSDLNSLKSIFYVPEHNKNKPYVNFTRVDIAFDDFSGVLNLAEIKEALLQKYDGGDTNYITSRWRSSEERRKYGDGGITHYIGSRDSSCFGRCYNKQAEQKVDYHWVRFELEYKDDKACQLVNAVSVSGSVYTLFESLRSYIRFNVPPSDGEDKTRQWCIAGWWSDFVEVSKNFVLGCGVPRSSVEKVHKWLEKQVAPALAVVAEALGPESILALVELGYKRFDKKHHLIVESYRELGGVQELVSLALSFGGQVVYDDEDRNDEQQAFEDWVLLKEINQVNKPKRSRIDRLFDRK